MTLQIDAMTEMPLDGQRILIRQDLNVPIRDGVITNDKRLTASLPTIQQALKANAAVILMSHLGRPKEAGSEEYNADFSLAPVAGYLTKALNQPVKLITDYTEQVVNVQPGEVVLLENVRFNQGEKANDDSLAKQYAALCDIFVMDAFGTAHRAQASTYGVAAFAPKACAGPLLLAELNALESALKTPKKPIVAIVGGAKVSTKLAVLERLADMCDHIIVGGGIANTFLAAKGHPVGQSLYEPDLIDKALTIMQKVSIPIPVDVVTGKSFSADTHATIKAVDEVTGDDMIFDIGPLSSQQLNTILHKAQTIIWNGPVGVFEFEAFAQGTKSLAEAIASSDAFSIAGGGDTLAAVDQFNITDQVSYISTGGGAFLEYVEGKKLPAVAILEQRAQK